MALHLARILHAGRLSMGSKRSFGQLRRLPSGRWQAGYTGVDTRVHRAPTTFTAKIDAEGWLASERRLVESGE